jgi:hypothetical protein
MSFIAAAIRGSTRSIRPMPWVNEPFISARAQPARLRHQDSVVMG